MKTLVLIPARGGSKGIPGKNKKLLGNQPLISYSIKTALKVFQPEDICVSTDDPEIASIATGLGVKVPFLRPGELSTDNTPTHDVIIHALNFFRDSGRDYSSVVLLQPTSPFRTAVHVKEAMDLYSMDSDMVVSVFESNLNPYYNLFEQNASGFLEKSKRGDYTRRQDCPVVYSFNGAIYIINSDSIRKKPMNKFERVKKYLMDQQASVDLDTPADWEYATYLMKKKLVNYET